MLPDPPWGATHGAVLADPGFALPTDAAMAHLASGWMEALTSVGLQLWAERGFVLIGAGVALLAAAGLSLWGRRGAGS